VTMAPDFAHRGGGVGVAQHDATLYGIWGPRITQRFPALEIWLRLKHKGYCAMINRPAALLAEPVGCFLRAVEQCTDLSVHLELRPTATRCGVHPTTPTVIAVPGGAARVARVITTGRSRGLAEIGRLSLGRSRSVKARARFPARHEHVRCAAIARRPAAQGKPTPHSAGRTCATPDKPPLASWGTGSAGPHWRLPSRAWGR
jgi:hypothetical protein